MPAAHSAKKRPENSSGHRPLASRYHFGKFARTLMVFAVLASTFSVSKAHADRLSRLRNGEVVKLLGLPRAFSRAGLEMGVAAARSQFTAGAPASLSLLPGRSSSTQPLAMRLSRIDSQRDKGSASLKAFSELLAPIRDWNDLLTWFKAYKSLPATDSQSELRAENINFTFFLLDPATGSMVPPASLMGRVRGQSASAISTWGNKDLQEHLRVSWSNRDLDQWVSWTQERDRAIVNCTDRLREAVLRDGPELLSSASDSDRLKSLLGWASVVAVLPGTPEGSALDAARVDSRDRAYAWTLKRMGLDQHPKLQSLTSPESQMIFRALALTLVPTLGDGDIQPDWKTPVDSPVGLIARLDAEGSGKSREFRTDWLETYRNYRDMDQPELPVHPAPHSEAVHVAFIDTGVDWKEHPELGEYLGLGREGELSQYDFADTDENPWVPAIGDLAHGSGVMATLLTLIAHQEPRILEERRLDMALWKTASIRSLMAVGSDPDLRRFDLRQELSYMQAFVEAGALSEERTRVVPDIVSISASFSLRRATGLSGAQVSFKSSPWVWVMAAGNGGRELNAESQDPSCMGDLATELKPEARLICVGALRRGILRDSISKYSNYGPLVDLYTYESFSGLCPSGTSCSTPAISAALAMIKARYQSLTADQLKQVLLEAASEKTVDQEVDGQKKSVRIRVFDPTTMMNRAYLIASRVARNRSR